MKRLSRILVVGEQNIFGELIQIVAMAQEANKVLAGMLGQTWNEKNVDAAMQGIRLLEKQSDDVAFKVSEDITTGAVSPNILDNLLESVHIADDIVDTYYYLSRELCRMSKAKFPYGESSEEQTQWNALFGSMLELAGKALSRVKQALEASDLKEVLTMRKQIESIEERGDDIKDEGFDWLYREAPDMHYLQFMHYSELLHKFDDVLDHCEDLSDLIVEILTSILK